MRSLKLNLGFYKKLCSDSFGVPLWPLIARKNNEYGGVDLKAFHLFMVNGV
jgi:hypothetical protein